MTQLATPATPLDTSSPQDNAWNCLLALETQVQTIQASLTLHTTELAKLCQTMNTISHSLQMLLEHLPPTPATTPALPTPSEMNPAPHFNISAASHIKIPCPALPDTYNSNWASITLLSYQLLILSPLHMLPLLLHHLQHQYDFYLQEFPWKQMPLINMHQHLFYATTVENLATLHGIAFRTGGVLPLSLSEQEELLLQFLAAKDSSGNPSPDASLVDPSSKISPAAPSTEQEEDF
ncbi:hypothetical protein C0995_007106 [Termitomyces sp. Mi166|nr:hypothetical protein C0995_007106 [Termitomyces sp. Mi166\